MAKILIVEDDPLMSRMYHKIFNFEKYEVEMAADGVEGFEKAKSTKPTIMLLDIMTPKLNGLEVLDRLKSDPKTQEIPVVMLTNLAGEHDAETALAKGAIRYIIKSKNRPAQVVGIVKEIISGYTRDEVPKASSEKKHSSN